MQNYFGVFRDGEYMKKGREELNALRERIASIVIGDKSKAFNTARLEALELQNLFEVAEATAIAADERTESRAHIRGVIILNVMIRTGYVTRCIIQN